MQPLAKDDPGTKEADPGDNLGGHLRRTSIAIQTLENYKAGRTDRNQRVGP